MLQLFYSFPLYIFLTLFYLLYHILVLATFLSILTCFNIFMLIQENFIHLKMTSERSKPRDFLALVLFQKSKKEQQKKLIEKPKDVGHFLLQKLSQNFDFCACPSQNVANRDAGGKKNKLSCCECVFD